MEKPIEVIDYKGYQINIHSDFDPMNPRTEFDNLGTIISFHNHYDLGDKHNYSNAREAFTDLAVMADPTVESKLEYWESGRGWASIARLPKAGIMSDENQKDIILKAIEQHYIMLNLYLYDHSGITIRTSPFSCPWDSGKVGFVYISKEKAKKEYSWKKMTKKRIEQIKTYLNCEIETYDQYLTGDVYGYIVSNEEDDHIHSCWGYFGHDWEENGLLEAAKGEIDYELSKEFEVLQFINNCFAL